MADTATGGAEAAAPGTITMSTAATATAAATGIITDRIARAANPLPDSRREKFLPGVILLTNPSRALIVKVFRQVPGTSAVLFRPV